MNARAQAGHALAARAGLLAALVLGAAACVALLAEPAAAGSLENGDAVREALRQADDHYQAGQWPQAEELYRHALPRTTGAEARHCYERLLALYPRAGRPDQLVDAHPAPPVTWLWLNERIGAQGVRILKQSAPRDLDGLSPDPKRGLKVGEIKITNPLEAAQGVAQRSCPFSNNTARRR